MSNTLLEQLDSVLARSGFCFAQAHQIRALLERTDSLRDWDQFSASWDHLAEDTYLAAHGHRRKRRHAAYVVSANLTVSRLAHQPHFQSRCYNKLQGGMDRWFEPITPIAGSSVSLHTILHFGAFFFNSVAREAHDWRIEVHQFRIEASQTEAGSPTPEGIHRDGVDYVLVLLVKRSNVSSGTTTIHSTECDLLDSFTLRDPLDTALLDDHRVLHGVTMIHPLDSGLPAWRDVLVVTFKRIEVS